MTDKSSTLNLKKKGGGLMSESRRKFRDYLLARVNNSYVLLQRHDNKEVCVIRKKGGVSIDPQFIAAIQENAPLEIKKDIRLRDKDSVLSLKADTENQFSFIFKC